jgi:AcrR family transcriptional regulator
VKSKRGGPRTLTEAQIVEAVRLAASVRLENASMRGLADELGVPVMTIYNDVANKDALHELVMDSVLARVKGPGPDDGTWEERLRLLEREARTALAHLPGVSIDRRDSPEGRRLAERGCCGGGGSSGSAFFDPADLACACASRMSPDRAAKDGPTGAQTEATRRVAPLASRGEPGGSGAHRR